MEWRDIKGYEGLYQVSDEGEVKSLGNGNSSNSKERILKSANNGWGYLQVLLYKNGKRKRFLIHKLVAMMFLPNPSNLPEINHKDENKQNNKVDNLEFCDRKYNTNYGTRNQKIAEKNSNGKSSKPVTQYSLNGHFIRQYPSTMEVQRTFGYNHNYISSACIGKYNQAYGYRWSYN